MDIHAPKGGIHSPRDFLLEIFTVTCGIVIALGLEAAVQRHHNQTLGRQVRDDFLTELNRNRDGIVSRAGADAADAAFLLKLIDYGTARQAHRPATAPSVTSGRSFTTLANNAWETALATQGIGQLSHAEVRALSAVYTTQAVFNQLEAQGISEWVQIAGYGDPAGVPDADVGQALRDLRICYALEQSAAAQEPELLARYDAALKLVGAAR